MIISKKRLQEIIDRAIRDEKEKQLEKDKIENAFTKIDRRIDDLSESVWKDIYKIRDMVDGVESEIRRKIEELSCKISHKRKR